MTTTEQTLLNNENNKDNARPQPKTCITCGGCGYIVRVETTPHWGIMLRNQRITTCVNCKGSGER